MGHYDCKECDASPYEMHSPDCSRVRGMPVPACKWTHGCPQPTRCSGRAQCQGFDPLEREAPGIGHNGGPPLLYDALPPATDSHTEANPKAAFGAAKPSLALVPGAAMVEMAGVFELGAKKYGPFNWRITKVEAMTYANAAMRHIMSWIDGEDIDPESGKSHLGHGMASLGIVIDAMHTANLIDNRPPKGATAALIAANVKKAA